LDFGADVVLVVIPGEANGAELASGLQGLALPPAAYGGFDFLATQIHFGRKRGRHGRHGREGDSENGRKRKLGGRRWV
jgi:hypothetical protein